MTIHVEVFPRPATDLPIALTVYEKSGVNLSEG